MRGKVYSSLNLYFNIVFQIKTMHWIFLEDVSVLTEIKPGSSPLG